MKKLFLGYKQFALIIFFIANANYGKSQKFTKITTGPLVSDSYSYGVAWIDYDKDGFLDLFTANYNGENYFYHNKGNGTFEKISNTTITTGSYDYSSGPSWGDFDNDGEPDLFVGTQGNTRNILLRNLGKGTFARITEGEIANDISDSYSSAWADYDNDGYLDIYVSNNSYFGTKKGESDLLYHNKKDGTFEKIISGKLGNDNADNTGVSWVDYNNDNKLDLFVTTWIGKNMLFKNTGNGFEQIITGDIVNDVSTSLSCAWGDYNNDGFMDVYVGNGFPNAEKNYLYFNNGDGTFRKSVNGPEVSEMVNAWLVSNGDYDNDADLDLFVASYQGRNMLFINNGEGVFTKIDTGAIYKETTSSTTSGGIGSDYDNDGDLDLFFANEGGTNYQYRNEGNNNSWVEFRLTGKESNSSAIGAKIKVKARIDGKDMWQVREVSSCLGMRSGNLTVHFGLSNAIKIDSLKILWPSGKITEKVNIPTDSIYYIEEEISAGFLRPVFKADKVAGKDTLKVVFSDVSICPVNEPVTSWQWDFDNDGVYDSNEKNPVYTYISKTKKNFSVKLKVSNSNKTDSILMQNYINLKGSPVNRLNETSQEYGSLKFNNPVNSFINVSYTKNTASLTRLELFNSCGKLVKVLLNATENSGYKESRINIDNSVENGFYIISLYSDYKYESGKLVIVR